MKTFLNVLGCIAATLFSIVLIMLVSVFSLYCGLTSFAKPEIIADTVSSAVQNIDLEAILPPAEDLQEIIPIEGVSTEAIEKLIASDTVSKAFGLYAQDVLDVVLKGETAGERQFTTEALKSLANEEIDAIVESVKPYMPEDVPEETIAKELKTLVDTHADVIVESLPLPTLPEESENDPFTVIRQILNPMITTIAILSIILLAILIYACRFPRFGGMLWLGVDAAVAALLTTALSITMGNSTILTLVAESDPSIATFVEPVISVFSRNLTVTAIICGVLAVALIVGYILLYRKFAKPIAVSEEPLLPEPSPAE